MAARRIVDLVLACLDRLDNRERRFALVDGSQDGATLGLIRHGELGAPLPLAVRAIEDTNVVVHKAAGWMLREVGSGTGTSSTTSWIGTPRRCPA